MTPPKDRRDRLLQSTTFNGIDFVELDRLDPKKLLIHFMNAVPVIGTITDVKITGGETTPEVKVLKTFTLNDPTYWTTETTTGQPILTINVASPSDFSRYTLTLNSTSLDRFFSQIAFSFKALCPSDLDCETPPSICPPDEPDLLPIDYLAKDFLSFRKALSDFSALRYPSWVERSEADFGVMFMEALCALADDLSYTQDRIAAEATLETATQRRSLIRHARLVDYEPRPATAARTLLQFDIYPGVTMLPVGLVVSAQSPDGEIVEFETGTGLVDPNTGKPNVDPNTGEPQPFAVNSRFNRNPGMRPYWWDDSQRCLKSGSTEMWIEGHGFNFQGEEALLIETAGATSADPKIREVVHLLDDPAKAAIEETDELFDPPVAVTRIVWQSKDALKFDRDLTRTILAGNLIPATQGRRYTETFTIPSDEPSSIPSNLPQALVRMGANSTPDDVTPQYLYTLRKGAIAWLEQDDPEMAPLPEILLQQNTGQAWTWRRRLLDANPFERAFTIDPVSFRRIALNSDRSVMFDYDSDSGDTIRFGDGTFGELPNPGDTFQVTYRVGGGAIGNVTADAITHVDPTVTDVIAVTNPFPATGGSNAESAERVRRLAPQAFRAKQFRAVRAEDYQAAAQSLPWVQRAGTVFRWTGSWLTVFTTPDPLGSEALTVKQHTELINLLNRYRLAGYESYVPSPRYISLDLEIRVCARPDAFRGDVEADLLVVLSAAKFPDGRTGFFHVDRWSFGQPLERSALEAAIQRAYGVAGVVSISYRQRGVTLNYRPLPDTFTVPVDAILRVDSDNTRPERGSLKIILEGGK
jgi:Baseplate J-like protein